MQTPLQIGRISSSYFAPQPTAKMPRPATATSSWSRTPENRDVVSDRAAAVRGEGGGWPQKPSGQGGDMTEYLIAFNDEWVPDHTVDELREKSKAVRALVAEMKAAGVFIFTGGLDDAAPVFSVDASSGTPLFTDGPFIESKEHLGGFAVVDVADEEAARLWAGRSRWPAVGRRRCDASGSPGNFRKPLNKSRRRFC